MPIYKEMQETFDTHMKTLDLIQSKLKQMKDMNFCSLNASSPLISQFYDWQLKQSSLIGRFSVNIFLYFSI